MVVLKYWQKARRNVVSDECFCHAIGYIFEAWTHFQPVYLHGVDFKFHFFFLPFFSEGLIYMKYYIKFISVGLEGKLGSLVLVIFDAHCLEFNRQARSRLLVSVNVWVCRKGVIIFWMKRRTVCAVLHIQRIYCLSVWQLSVWLAKCVLCTI